MREEIFYTESTRIKDLTVGELKDIIFECLLKAQTYRTPMNCIGKEFNVNSKNDGNDIIY